MKYLRELKYESIDQILWVTIKTEPIEKELTEESPYWDAWQQKVAWDDKITNIDEVITRYAEKASTYKEFSRITAICYGRVIDGGLKVKEIASEDEKQLIEKFFADVENVISRGVKFLGGFSVLQFAIPFISFRAMVHDIPMISSFDVAAIAPWNIKHVVDIQNLLRGTSSTMISLLGATAGFNLPSPKEEDLKEHNLAVVNLFCKYTGIPQSFLGDSAPVQEEPLPILTKLYNTKQLNKEELISYLKERGLKKSTPKKEKEELKKIVLAHWLERIDVMDFDEVKKEKTATNEKRTAEINELINSI